jgi:hypothetical protein
MPPEGRRCGLTSPLGVKAAAAQMTCWSEWSPSQLAEAAWQM